MIWQDIVISICQVLFVFALLPMIFSEEKPPLSTCVFNTILVATIATCLFTLELWLAAGTGYAIMFAWLVLVIQKLRRRHPADTSGVAD